MPFDPKAIANYFLALAEAKGQSLTPMKLQKLVYFANGWYLALAGKPLINEQVEAWKYGPVIPSLYKAFQPYGNAPIGAPASHRIARRNRPSLDDVEFVEVVPKIEDKPEEAEAVRPLLDKVWDIYGKYSAIQLSNITHDSGTPWFSVSQEYHGQIPKRTDIPPNLIKKYFRSLQSAGTDES